MKRIFALLILVAAVISLRAQFSTNAIQSIAASSPFSTNAIGNRTNAPFFLTNVPGSIVVSTNPFSTNAIANRTNAPAFATNAVARIVIITPTSTNIVVGSTNILVAFGEFTNYADKFYWNPNFTFTDNGGDVAGAYTNGSSMLIDQGGAPGLVFVGISGDVGSFVGTLAGIGNAIYNNLAGDFNSVTNGWPGTSVGYPGPYISAGSYFRFQQPVTNITYVTNTP